MSPSKSNSPNARRRLCLALSVAPFAPSALAGPVDPVLPAGAASPDTAPPAPAPAPAPAPEHDRTAILAMAGEYRVSFEFTETVALRSGYATRPATTSAGTELVVVLEDHPTRIVLQHLLLDTRRNAVVKHWRQDWTWQDGALLEFRGDRRWQRRRLDPAAVAGCWTQSVHDVDDSPRYASLGRWEHRGGTSEWVSENTWRPLPRREHTTRDDYDVLLGVNRHIVTPWGWVHAQDNTKLDLRRDLVEPLLARENGTNSYRRITDVDFTPARDYWQRTGAYWEAVRRQWHQLTAATPGVVIDLDIDGVPLLESLLGLADDGARPLPERQRLASVAIGRVTRSLAQAARR